MPSAVGSLARNFHYAGRTEYLAQYVFSGLGSASAIPHQEDSGIDLYCTLGTPDPEEHRRLSCRHPFFVQVKSNTNSIEFTNHMAVEWLTSLPQPYFICIVDQKNLRIRLYHSLSVFLVTMVRQLPERLTFMIGQNNETKTNDGWVTQFYDFDANTIYTSTPVLDFTMKDMVGSQKWYEKTVKIMEGWLKLLEFNIAMRTVGLPVVRFPDKYQTNELLEIVDHINDPVIVGGNYTEIYNPGYATDKQEFRNLLKKVYASQLFFREEADEIGEKVAWLLAHELKSDPTYSESKDKSDPFHTALARFRVTIASKKQS